MVGDRQEKYKKQAALKEKDQGDTTTKQSDTRRKLEALQSELDHMRRESGNQVEKKALTPSDIFQQVPEE